MKIPGIGTGIILVFTLGHWSCSKQIEVNRRLQTERASGPISGAEAAAAPQIPEASIAPDPMPPAPKPKAELPPVALSKPFPGDTYGCKEPYEKPWTCEDYTINNLGQGSFLSLQRSGAKFLLAAPHGWFDAGTDAIAYSIFPKEIPEGYPIWSQLIAHSFRGNAPAQTQHNVNRPSTLTNDVCNNPTDLATSAMVYQAFTAHMDRLSQRPQLYFEIHGHSEPGLETSLELATERISMPEANMIRKIFQEELLKAGISGISVVIEPLDTVFFNAGLTKLCGSINHIKPAPAIHAELPRIMRDRDESQLRSAKFFRATLNRLALEVFGDSRSPPLTQVQQSNVNFEAIID